MNALLMVLIAAVFCSLVGISSYSHAADDDMSLPQCLSDNDISAVNMIRQDFLFAIKSNSGIAAATLGDAKAIAKKCSGQIAYLLALTYLNGELVKRDVSEGEYWLHEAIGKGIFEARLELARVYIYEVSPSRSNEGVLIYEDLAKAGNAKALYALAYIYQKGIYKEKDWKRAEKYYEESYLAGYPPAAYALGAILYESENYQKSVKYFEESLRLERNPSALFYLGLLDVNGINGDQARVLGRKKIEEACKVGLQEACDFLGSRGQTP